jgi:UDP-GlcNAc3NAcA epimerase
MPEEVNRILTYHLSDLLFAPSAEAKQNLIKEGISEKQIRVVGDVMYDVALHYADRAKTRSSILSNLHLTAKGFVLATVHRAANTDDFSRLSKIIGGLTRIADHIPVIWPIHPRVRAILARIGQQNFPPTLRLVSPVGYLDMAMLEQNALVIVTDSGGVQKEAFFHHVRCVTLREETEWRELVEHNYNQLCPPTSETTIEETVTKALELSKTDMQDTTLPSWPQIYGNGGAATLIAAELLSAHH